MEMPDLQTVTSDKNVDRFAKVGYAARAVVYGLIGIFAAMIALGKDGALTDNRGALRELMAQPFGTTLLIIVAIGLLGYAVWRVLQAIRDYDHRGNDAKGLAVRAGYFFGGIAHAFLAYSAINLIFRLSRESKQSQDSAVATWLLDKPFGQILVGIVALSISAFGIGQIYIALKEKFTRGLDIPADKQQWLYAVCKFGLISRGIMFGIVGWLFMRAALTANASQAQGVRGAWRFLAGQPFGNMLVAIIAFGFMAFAVYGFTESRYRRTV
ncbi:MAG: DUF1206 domain-containing protein [Proteobacteria bacterium]|nr:MAG: DUF1206 domain-containing protein [Pseudomonadota bacterium]